MIEVASSFILAVLKGVRTRMNEAATVLDWAVGRQVIDLTNAQDLVQAFPTDKVALAKAQTAFLSHTKRVQSIAPRALKVKRGTAIGEVAFSDTTIEPIIPQAELRRHAREVFTRLFALGIAGVRAFVHESGEARLERLGGYLEPLYAEDDVDGRVTGLYQVLDGPDGRGFTVRVYDFSDSSIREWVGIAEPWMLGIPPASVLENQLMPRLAIFETDQAGRPVGELMQALNNLRAEVGAQMRILRVSEQHSNPHLFVAGDWDAPVELGASTVLRTMDANGKVGRVEAARLEGLFTEQDRTLERLRGDLQLPVGFLGTGNFPSGEALEQANASFISSAQEYRTVTQELLTEGLADLASLRGVEPPVVEIRLNRERLRKIVSDQARADFAAGLIPLGVAVHTIAPYYPLWTPEEIEQFILTEESLAPPTITPTDLANST